MGDAMKHLLVILGSQAPMLGIAVAWWSGVLKDPLVAAGAAVVYELIVFVWGFLGKDVWEELKPDIVKASTDWIKVGVLNVLSDFRRRYKKHVMYEHRVFGSRGLRTTGQGIVELEAYVNSIVLGGIRGGFPDFCTSHNLPRRVKQNNMGK